MRILILASIAAWLTACATSLYRSNGWIDVDPGYCVDGDSLGRDAHGLTHVRVSPNPCAHDWGHTTRMEFIFDCAAVRRTPTADNGQIGAGYSYRNDPDDDWQRSDSINQDHTRIARFACGG